MVTIPSGEGQLPEVPNGIFQFSRQRSQQVEGVGRALSTEAELKLNRLGVSLPVLQLDQEVVPSLLDEVMDLLQTQPEVT